MRRIVSFLILIGIVAMPAAAQKGPDDAIGFNAEKIYNHFEGLDSVAGFNGNLSITIPLARYSVSSSLSFVLTLVYNGKSIDWEGYDDYSVPNPPQFTWSPHPSLGGDAGLGWRVTLGRLHPPGSPSMNQRSTYERTYFTWEGPSGDEHEFTSSSDSNASVLLTSDAAALRLVKIEGQPYPTRDVEMPSGEVHRFQQRNTDWRLTQIRDGFGGVIVVSYEYDTTDTRRAKKWFISETVDGVTRRSHTLHFEYQSSMAYAASSRGMQLTSIDVTGRVARLRRTHSRTRPRPSLPSATSASGCSRR